jgi:outer membrane protein TolC
MLRETPALARESPLARRVARTLRSSPSPHCFSSPVARRTSASDAWWEAYGDLQLNQLIEEALADSPDLKAPAARARGATAMADVAGASLWPTVTGAASVTKIEQSTNQGMSAISEAALPHGWHTSGQIAAKIEYELDFFGKNRATLAAATSEAQAAEAEQSEARLQISAAVAETYASLGQLFADRRATPCVCAARAPIWSTAGRNPIWKTRAR